MPQRRAWPLWLQACPTVPLQPDFDVQRYLGRWYEIFRLRTTRFEDGDCVTAEYSQGDPRIPSRIDVKNTQHHPFRAVKGCAMKRDKDPAELKVYFDLPFPLNLIPGNYRVLYTDYERVAVVYSCSISRWNQGAWILSRTRDLTGDEIDKAFGVLRIVDLHRDDFVRTNQLGCPE